MVSEETLQLILTSALDICIRGGCDGIWEVLLILAVVDVGLDLHQDAIGRKLHNTQVQGLELLSDRRRVIASLLQILGPHDGEQVIIRLAINVLLASAQLTHTLLDVLLELLTIRHRKEGTVQRRLRLTLVHGLRDHCARQILLRNVATRTNAVALVGNQVSLGFANVGNATRVLRGVKNGGLRKEIRKGLHTCSKSRLKDRLSSQVGCIGGQDIQFKRVYGLKCCVQERKCLVVPQNLVNVQNFEDFIVIDRIGIDILEDTIGIANCKIGNEKDVKVIDGRVGQTWIRCGRNLLIGFGIECVFLDGQYRQCFSNQRKSKILFVLVVAECRRLNDVAQRGGMKHNTVSHTKLGFKLGIR